MAGLSAAGCGLVSPRSQQPVRTPRIGYRWTGEQEWADAFREGLAELGYVEGSTVTVEWPPTTGRSIASLAPPADLGSLPVDVLVASGALNIQAAMRATSTIPIVMARTIDPAHGRLCGQSCTAGQATLPGRPASPAS